MSVAKKRKLSGSADGKAIKITTTATPGDTIHAAVGGQVAGTFDEIWLWAYNGHTGDVVLTLEWGGVEVPDQNIILTIPTKVGLYPVVPGLILQNGMVVKAYANITNVITLSGYVNYITD